MDAICAPRGGVLTIGCLRSLTIGLALCSSFCFAFIEVSLWGRQGSYVGWSICSGEGVEAVAAGSDCWAGCGCSYELGCRGSLALVNEEGKAGGACADGACAGGACIGGACTNGACADVACIGGACIGGACAGRACADEACAGGAYIDGACAGGACTGGAYMDGACTNGACADGACVGGACMGGAYADEACIGGAVIVAGVGRLGRGSSFEACGLIAFS